MPEIILFVLIAAVFVLLVLFVGLWWIYDVVSGWLANLWNGLTGETARRKKREEEAQKEEEERKQRQQERQRKRQEAEERERKQFRTENSEVFAGIADLLSTGRAPAVEIMRAVGAIEGKDFERDPKLFVLADVGYILASFSSAESTRDAYREKLWEEVTRTIKPPDGDGVPSLSVIKNHGVKQLGMVSLLADYDKLQGTTLSSKAASTYLSIVSAVYNRCYGSLATKMVADTYNELLRPYIHESGGEGYAGSSTSSASGNSNSGTVCQKCAKSYLLLDLPFGATRDEVEQKKLDLGQVFHSDHLSSKSEGVRYAAEEHHKRINEACDQILRCPSCARTRTDDGINGSESPPAPHQSTSATTAGEKTKHQPSPASSSDESKEGKQEHRHEVRSDQDLIDAIDATRKKVDATTKRMEEFLEQMKGRKQTSLERL